MTGNDSSGGDRQKDSAASTESQPEPPVQPATASSTSQPATADQEALSKPGIPGRTGALKRSREKWEPSDGGTFEVRSRLLPDKKHKVDFAEVLEDLRVHRFSRSNLCFKYKIAHSRRTDTGGYEVDEFLSKVWETISTEEREQIQRDLGTSRSRNIAMRLLSNGDAQLIAEDLTRGIPSPDQGLSQFRRIKSIAQKIGPLHSQPYWHEQIRERTQEVIHRFGEEMQNDPDFVAINDATRNVLGKVLSQVLSCMWDCLQHLPPPSMPTTSAPRGPSLENVQGVSDTEPTAGSHLETAVPPVAQTPGQPPVLSSPTQVAHSHPLQRPMPPPYIPHTQPHPQDPRYLYVPTQPSAPTDKMPMTKSMLTPPYTGMMLYGVRGGQGARRVQAGRTPDSQDANRLERTDSMTSMSSENGCVSDAASRKREHSGTEVAKSTGQEERAVDEATQPERERDLPVAAGESAAPSTTPGGSSTENNNSEEQTPKQPPVANGSSEELDVTVPPSKRHRSSPPTSLPTMTSNTVDVEGAKAVSNSGTAATTAEVSETTNPPKQAGVGTTAPPPPHQTPYDFHYPPPPFPMAAHYPHYPPPGPLHHTFHHPYAYDQPPPHISQHPYYQHQRDGALQHPPHMPQPHMHQHHPQQQQVPGTGTPLYPPVTPLTASDSTTHKQPQLPPSEDPPNT